MATKKNDNLVKVKTESGFECTVDKSRLNDWSLTRAAVAVSDTQSEMDAHRFLMLIFDRLFDADTQKALEDFATVDGIVRTDKVEEVINEILIGLKAKN